MLESGYHGPFGGRPRKAESWQPSAHTIGANGKPVVGFVGIGSIGGARARRL
jgi:hypothetical protein